VSEYLSCMFRFECVCVLIALILVWGLFLIISKFGEINVEK